MSKEPVPLYDGTLESVITNILLCKSGIFSVTDEHNNAPTSREFIDASNFPILHLSTNKCYGLDKSTEPHILLRPNAWEEQGYVIDLIGEIALGIIDDDIMPITFTVNSVSIKQGIKVLKVFTWNE